MSANDKYFVISGGVGGVGSTNFFLFWITEGQRRKKILPIILKPFSNNVEH